MYEANSCQIKEAIVDRYGYLVKGYYSFEEYDDTIVNLEEYKIILKIKKKLLTLPLKNSII